MQFVMSLILVSLTSIFVFPCAPCHRHGPKLLSGS